EMLARHEAKAAVPTLLALARHHAKSRNNPMERDTSRPGNYTIACQNLSAMKDKRAVAEMVKILEDAPDDAGGGMFGGAQVVINGMPGHDSGKADPLFQAILELTGQSPRKYKMRTRKAGPLAMLGGGEKGLSETLVFDDDDARSAAVEKFKAWWK